jgi:hypothetical protein
MPIVERNCSRDGSCHDRKELTVGAIDGTVIDNTRTTHPPDLLVAPDQALIARWLDEGAN